jgi:hypothetical protein
MASRSIMLGTGVALAGLGGLAAAAVTVGAPTTTTTTKPAAQAVETQTQLVTTVEHRTERLHARKSDRGTVFRQATAAPAAAPTRIAQPAAVAAQPTPSPVADVRQSRGADDGAAHDLGDDHGGRGRGGHGGGGDSGEPGDD